MSFEVLDVDSLLQTLSFMNAQSLARTACSHRLGAVAAHEAQQRPSLLVLKGRLEDVTQDLRHKLAGRPTVAFLNWSTLPRQGETIRKEMLDFVRTRLPKETVVLGAATNSLLCALHRDTQPASTVLEVGDDEQDAEHVGLLVATLPEAQAHVFDLEPQFRGMGGADMDSSDYDEEDEDEDEESEVAEDERDEEGAEQQHGVEGTAHSNASAQAEGTAGYPTSGASQEDKCEQDSGAACDWLQSLAEPNAEASAETAEAEPNQLKKLLSLNPPPSVVVIQDTVGARGLVQTIQAKYPQAAVIGGSVMGREVLVKDSKRSETRTDGASGILAITGNAPLFALTSPMQRSISEAVKDVQGKMKLAESLASKEEKHVLGALLFTCCARSGNLFGTEGKDAQLFQECFPNAPLLGYYAGGEIGPKTRGGSDDQQTFEKGNAQFQGYTAVYGFFLVPQKHVPSLAFQRAVLYGEVKEAFQQLHSK